MAKKVLTEHFTEALNGATAAKVDVHAGDGNLTIGRLAGGGQTLAACTLQYSERQGPPARSLECSGGRATLTLRGGRAGQRWLRLPWAACNGATEWQIHLNPTVSCDITAHSDGGNVRLDLDGMSVTRVAADTGGGNVEVTLPDGATDLSVMAKTGAGNVTVEIGPGATGSHSVQATSGAGNVTVCVPGGLAARIHATSGLGKVIVDPRFSQTGKDTYQSPDYDGAAHKVELTAHSGAGNVSVQTE
jgi:hypothetical protein